MKTIHINNAIKENFYYIDTRSPKEFEIDHIPNSINLPIFNDEERHNVGLLYKKNQNEAYMLGFNYFEKKKELLKKDLLKINKNSKIIVYCWRGGLRSKTMTEFVNDLGYDGYQLLGGYKAYRAYVRNELDNYKPNFKLIVLQGLAGCGKTDLIRQFNNSLDLEGYANHRASNFGAIGLKPNSQKMFESLLLDQIKKLKKENYVFIEGESQKIGDLFIPSTLFSAMKNGLQVGVNSDINNRVKRIVRDYFTYGEDGQIIKIIILLKPYITKTITDKLIEMMNQKNYEEVAKILLEKYYDEKYKHLFDDIKFDYQITSEKGFTELNKILTLIK